MARMVSPLTKLSKRWIIIYQKNAHIHFWGYHNQILTSSEIRDPLFKPPYSCDHIWYLVMFMCTQEYSHTEKTYVSCPKHASMHLWKASLWHLITLVWSLEKPLVSYISSPFRLRLSYPQSDASMAPIQYCAQAEVHGVKLCSKVSGIARPQNRSLSATVRILVYVTAPEIVCQKKKMRDSAFVIFHRFVCKSLCGRLCLG